MAGSDQYKRIDVTPCCIMMATIIGGDGPILVQFAVRRRLQTRQDSSAPGSSDKDPPECRPPAKT